MQGRSAASHRRKADCRLDTSDKLRHDDRQLNDIPHERDKCNDHADGDPAIVLCQDHADEKEDDLGNVPGKRRRVGSGDLRMLSTTKCLRCFGKDAKEAAVYRLFEGDVSYVLKSGGYRIHHSTKLPADSIPDFCAGINWFVRNVRSSMRFAIAIFRSSPYTIAQ